MCKKLTTESFINRSSKIHNNIYLYDDSVYINSRTKIKIKCNLHGYFYQNAKSHLNGNGCPKCAIDRNRNRKPTLKLTTASFIKKSISKHGNKYDYSSVNFINLSKKVNILCKKHGIFSQSPKNHLNGQNCPDCSIESNTYTKEKFIERCISKHGHKYDYTKSVYISMRINIKIVCKEHGEFETTPFKHLNSDGCVKCSNDNQSYNTEYFIKRSTKVHKGNYGYRNSKYTGIFNEISVTCKKHGDFITKPNMHFRGQGCPKCSISKGEVKIVNFLTEKNINFNTQQTFSGCLSENSNKLKFDFYLPEKNICIEYDGEQHFKPIEYFGGVENFKKQKERDIIKNNYCLENNIKLIRISFNNYNHIESILNSEI
jgi:hypothetical protein